MNPKIKVQRRLKKKAGIPKIKRIEIVSLNSFEEIKR